MGIKEAILEETGRKGKPNPEKKVALRDASGLESRKKKERRREGRENGWPSGSWIFIGEPEASLTKLVPLFCTPYCRALNQPRPGEGGKASVP